MPRGDLIQVRRGIASLWSSRNPVLAEGEPGYVTDEDLFLLGDGVTAYNDLGPEHRYLSEAGVLELGSSGRELAYAESTAPQTGITTTVTDVTNCTITFDVGDRPVYVIGHVPQIYALSAASIGSVRIRDAAGTTIRQAYAALDIATSNDNVTVMERIATPGTYTRKLSIVRTGGTGNLNINSATDTPASIRAIEA